MTTAERYHTYLNRLSDEGLGDDKYLATKHPPWSASGPELGRFLHGEMFPSWSYLVPELGNALVNVAYRKNGAP